MNFNSSFSIDEFFKEWTGFGNDLEIVSEKVKKSKIEEPKSSEAEGKVPLTRLTLQERIRCVRYFSLYEKASYIQKAWRRDYGTEPPSRKTITALNKKFDETGSVADLSRSGRPKSSRTEEKVALVQAALLKDPSRSIRSLSNELGVNKAAVHRIKKETENKRNSLKSENKRLREKVAELRRKLEAEEGKKAEEESKEQTPTTTTAQLIVTGPTLTLVQTSEESIAFRMSDFEGMKLESLGGGLTFIEETTTPCAHPPDAPCNLCSFLTAN